MPKGTPPRATSGSIMCKKGPIRTIAEDLDDDGWIAHYVATMQQDIREAQEKDKIQRADIAHADREPGTCPDGAAKRIVCGGSSIRGPPAQSAPAMGECCFAEVVYPEGAELLTAGSEAPRYTKLKVTLDSGAGAHVINQKTVPGHEIKPSAMSRAGARVELQTMER